MERVPVAQFAASTSLARSNGDCGRTPANSVSPIAAAAARQGRAGGPPVSMFVSNPAYEAHQMYEDMEDPAETIVMPRIPMTFPLTSAVGATTGMPRSSRSSETAGLLVPASSHKEVLAVAGSSTVGRSQDSRAGGEVVL